MTTKSINVNSLDVLKARKNRPYFNNKYFVYI